MSKADEKMTLKQVRDKYFGGIDYTKIHTCPCCGHVFHDEGDDEKENELLDDKVRNMRFPKYDWRKE